MEYNPQEQPIKYPERLPTQEENPFHLQIERTPLEVFIRNIETLPNEEYALARKNGLGTSDASAVLGVNPYTTTQELIKEKIRTYLTAEEKEVGNETAVRKGNDLEPLIIKKCSEHFNLTVEKPADMYRHKDYPFLTFNYDGVIDDPKQYIPVEIKVVTARGEKRYNPTKAYYREGIGYGVIPPKYGNSNTSIQTKAAQYGIPPYYYTQLQQQILGLHAPYGYLAVLMEVSWKLHAFFIWRDDNMLQDLIIEGYKVWQQVEMGKGLV